MPRYTPPDQATEAITGHLLDWILPAAAILPAITGPRLWEVLRTLDGFGLADLDAGSAAVPAARLHPLVRDTSQPAPGDRLAFLELAARLLRRAAAADETGSPEDPQMRVAWQLLC